MAEQQTLQTQVLHELGDRCVLIGDLAQALGKTSGQVGQAAALLIARGYVERVDRGCFQLTEGGREAVREGVTIETGVTGPSRAPRRQPRHSIRQRAWNAMRIQRQFTVRDVVTAVAEARDGNVEENLRRYLCALTSAGYVRRSRRRQPGTAPGSNGYCVYTLLKNTGPLAPLVSLKRRAVHDFNLGEDVPCLPS